MDEHLNNSNEEMSPGGSKIYRHEDVEREWVFPEKFGVYMDEICAHMDKLYPNRKSYVLHEIVSDLVHIDVHVIEANSEIEGEDFQVIFTTGMSDLPMTMPDEMADEEKEIWQLAELVMLLPASQIKKDMPEEDYWPINLIKYLARLPHEYNTWLGDGHTVPNGPDYEPIVQNSQMSGVVIVGLGEDISPLTTKAGKQIHLLMVVPISKAETQYKLEKGMDELMQLLSNNNVSVITDIHRNSCL